MPRDTGDSGATACQAAVGAFRVGSSHGQVLSELLRSAAGRHRRASALCVGGRDARLHAMRTGPAGRSGVIRDSRGRVHEHGAGANRTSRCQRAHSHWRDLHDTLLKVSTGY